MTIASLQRVRRAFKKDSRQILRVRARSGPLQAVTDNRIDAAGYALLREIAWGAANVAALRRGQTLPLTAADEHAREESDKSAGFTISDKDVIEACKELGITPWIRKRKGHKVHSGIFLSNKRNQERAAKVAKKRADRKKVEEKEQEEEEEKEEGEEEKKSSKKSKSKK